LLIKVKFFLKHAMNIQRGSIGTAVIYSFLNLDESVPNAAPRPLYPWERDPVPFV
jgi:hypothetical protein